MDENPRRIIIARESLPKDGMFVLVYEKPYRNAESAASWGVEEGTRYLAESGRVDGWHAEYDRSVRMSRTPEYVYIAAILFKTASGPIYATEMLSEPCVSDDNRTSMVERDLNLVDRSYLCLWKKMQPNGQYYFEYQVNLVYRNTLAEIYAGGYEDTFDLEIVLELAKLQADTLMAMPLTDTVEWSP